MKNSTIREKILEILNREKVSWYEEDVFIEAIVVDDFTIVADEIEKLIKQLIKK